MCTVCDYTNTNTILEFVCSMSAVMVSMAELFLWHTHPVSCNCAYRLRMELSDDVCFPNFVRNCCWTIVTERHSWNISHLTAVRRHLSELRSKRRNALHYCTPYIIKENSENILIYRCSYILLSQVYCVWQFVKTPTIISNNPVCKPHSSKCMNVSTDHLWTSRGFLGIREAHFGNKCNARFSNSHDNHHMKSAILIDMLWFTVKRVAIYIWKRYSWVQKIIRKASERWLIFTLYFYNTQLEQKL
jgi:hypothetical protein